MTINFRKKRFYFKSDSININVEKPGFGFDRTFKNNQLIVGYIWDKELKEKIKYGDEIIGINGVEINESSLCDLVIGDLDLKNLSTVTFKIRSEENVIVELKIDKKLPEKIN